MKIETFLFEVDCKLSEKWEEDRINHDYTENDSYTAAVLTRIDTGSNLSINTYNSKLLRSINIGVWGIFVVFLMSFLTQFI